MDNVALVKWQTGRLPLPRSASPPSSLLWTELLHATSHLLKAGSWRLIRTQPSFLTLSLSMQQECGTHWKRSILPDLFKGAAQVRSTVREWGCGTLPLPSQAPPHKKTHAPTSLSSCDSFKQSRIVKSAKDFCSAMILPHLSAPASMSTLP